MQSESRTLSAGQQDEAGCVRSDDVRRRLRGRGVVELVKKTGRSQARQSGMARISCQSRMRAVLALVGCDVGEACVGRNQGGAQTRWSEARGCRANPMTLEEGRRSREGGSEGGRKGVTPRIGRCSKVGRGEAGKGWQRLARAEGTRPRPRPRPRPKLGEARRGEAGTVNLGQNGEIAEATKVASARARSRSRRGARIQGVKAFRRSNVPSQLAAQLGHGRARGGGSTRYSGAGATYIPAQLQYSAAGGLRRNGLADGPKKIEADSSKMRADLLSIWDHRPEPQAQSQVPADRSAGSPDTH
ncbi:hypothetical protein L1887_55785 [Cichorium endivia]|nr:hypothetical protein L1887_55785 [Cichorium endivia]